MSEPPVPQVPPPTDSARPRRHGAPVPHRGVPAVTVVTPVHDDADHLAETARSLACQTLHDFEWIVVDDGSVHPDTSHRIAEAIATIPGTRVLRHESDRGLAAARNTGLAAARADLVMQLDADDLLEPTALEKLRWCLLVHPTAGFAKGHTAGFGAESYIWENGFDNPDGFRTRNLADSIAMVRRDLTAGGYDESIRDGLEDWDFWMRCAAAGTWGVTVPEVLGWYRRRPLHGSRWPNWDGGEREAAFRHGLQTRYPGLWSHGMPSVPLRPDERHRTGPLPRVQPMPPHPRSLMVLVGDLDPDREHVLTRALGHLERSGWRVGVALLAASPHTRLARYLQATPDVVAPIHVGGPAVLAAVSSDMVVSRAPGLIAAVGRGTESLVAHLRRAHPGARIVEADLLPSDGSLVAIGGHREIPAVAAADCFAVTDAERRRVHRHLGLRRTAVAVLAGRPLPADSHRTVVIHRTPPPPELGAPRARHVLAPTPDDVARVVAACDAALPGGDPDLVGFFAAVHGTPIHPASTVATATPPTAAGTVLAELLGGDPGVVAPVDDDSIVTAPDASSDQSPACATDSPGESLRLPRGAGTLYRWLRRIAPRSTLAIRDRMARRRGIVPLTTLPPPR